jgi:hypothetical protein
VEIRRKIMVEATEGCSINQGRSANRIKSTKFENKFCRLAQRRLKFSKTNEDFQKLTKISPESMHDRNTRIVNFVNSPSNFHAKRQGGGGWRFFKKKTYSLPYLHKNFEIVHQRLQQLVQKSRMKVPQHVLVYSYCLR